ncbi:hypothetical protein TNCV_1313601 [Trichonephila clavipes]|nr:hypothetical protein TNCV_1313601 [Trichonephila clavipes]
MLIEARLAGASVSRTANIVNVLKTTMSWDYTNLIKVSSAKHDSEGISKMNDRGIRVFIRGYLPQNARLHSLSYLENVSFSGWNATLNRDPVNWTKLQKEQVIWSDESLFTLLRTPGVYLSGKH